jgi:hypothetical protein
MLFHYQNLNDKPGDRQGSILKYGRAWLNFRQWDVDGPRIHWEWHLDWRACAAQIEVGGEEDFGLHWYVGIPLLGALYVTLAGFRSLEWFARLLLPKTEERHGGLHGYRESRQIYFRVHAGALWWTIWRHSMGGWSREVPRWREGNFQVVDALLGKQKYAATEIEPWRAIEVPMPERAYRGRAKLELATWRRSRWFSKSVLRVEIDMDKGEQIPCPGKGENSWDCGDDGTWGLTCPAKSIEEGIGKLVTSCLETRRRRGAPHNWNQRRAA